MLSILAFIGICQVVKCPTIINPRNYCAVATEPYRTPTTHGTLASASTDEEIPYNLPDQSTQPTVFSRTEITDYGPTNAGHV